MLRMWNTDILKFEYFAQLLLDSNYIPLALKYFALQDVDKAVDSKHDRDDLGYVPELHPRTFNYSQP